MSATITIPSSITPATERLVAELSMRTEMELMIEKIGTSIPGVLDLEVLLQAPYDTGGGDQVILHARCDEEVLERSGWSEWDYLRWMIDTFPPQVCEHFTLMSYFGA